MSAQLEEVEEFDPCGTYAGYQRHKGNGEASCEPCREANVEYHRAYVAAHPEYARRNRQQTAALARAKTRVARAHPDELLRAYDEELQRHDEEGTP